MRTVPIAWTNPALWMREAANAINSLIGSTQYVGTVAKLPTGAQGMRGLVTDATATTFASAVVGGGANVVPVYHNGTTWVIG